jgi:hypothetical protein
MVALDLVKNHLNIHPLESNPADDCYIQQLIETAEAVLETELNINLCDIPHKHFNIVTMCVCQLVGNMYEFREAGNKTNLSFNVNSLPTYQYIKALIRNYGDHAFG